MDVANNTDQKKFFITDELISTEDDSVRTSEIDPHLFHSCLKIALKEGYRDLQFVFCLQISQTRFFAV